MSEVVRFRQEQALREQAAQQALYGFAAVAIHSSITARMERGAEYLLALLEEGKYEEVAHLMETSSWALEEATRRTTTNDNTQSEQQTERRSSL